MKRIYIYIAVLGLTTFGCKPKIDEFSPSSGGQADFTRYVALGNSLTSGYMDNALYIEGQKNSYAALLAQQLQTVGSGDFKIPFMVDENGIGFSGTTPVTKLVLGPMTDCKGVTSLSPVLAGTANLANLASIASQGPFNNMGVPGAKSFHLIAPGYGNPAAGAGKYSPYFYRMASNPATASVLSDAMRVNPTFFTLWIGNNDVLGFALAGGVGETITPNATLTYSISAVVDTLMKNGAKGAIANIPDVTKIAYFNTVPYNALVLTSQSQVDALNMAYAPLGITFALGANPLIVSDAAAPGGRRKIKSTEKIILTIPQDSIKCSGWGSQVPIADKYYLDEGELSQITDAVDGYNASIANIASTRKLALVDMHANLNRLLAPGGIDVDGVNLNATFVTGGVFSLDGFHLTPRGYAACTNYFIDAINQHFGANVPKLNVGQYRGVKLP